MIKIKIFLPSFTVDRVGKHTRSCFLFRAVKDQLLNFAHLLCICISLIEAQIYIQTVVKCSQFRETF